MIKKHKKLILFLVLLACSAIVAAVGLRFFPFSKVIKMPSGAEKEFTNPGLTSAPSPNTLYVDFEVPKGKEVPGGFYKGLAHSGQYSVKAFGQNSFSATIERTANEIGLRNLSAVALSAWIYVFPTTKEVKGSLVFTASNDLGVNVCWQGVSVHEPEVPRGKWFKISGYFDLRSVTFKPGYKIQMYFWNTSSTDILIDDYFAVFGGAVDRRGDSALVDLTRAAGYTPRFNFPPFPVSYLEKDSIETPVKPSDIGKDDLIVAGNFFHLPTDGLLVFRKDGSCTGFSYCKENQAFVKIPVTGPARMSVPVRKIIPGNFSATGSDDIVIVTDKNFLLCTFNPVKEPCSGNGTASSEMKIIARADLPSGSVYAGDFTGSNKTELLIVGPSGSWKIMVFEPSGKEPGNWKTIAENNDRPVPEWNQQLFTTGINSGAFIPGQKRDQLLTVSRSKANQSCSYSLLRFDQNKASWEPIFFQKGQGKTIGLDTLKPEDKFFMAKGSTGSSHKIFRYNRDWRFDLKEISFNDTSFAILSGVDFHGYDRDQNPKYYEMLALIPGYFVNPSATSFVVIGKNARERGYEKILPDFIRLYSVPKSK